MTRMTAAWLIVMLLAACTNRTKIPTDIIQQKKMEKVLWDMTQADRYVSSFIMTVQTDSPDVKKEKAALFYEKIFDLNNISREEFLKSYKFYLGRPDLLKPMYDSIAARAERQRNEMYRQSPKTSMMGKRDSLLHADSLRRGEALEKPDSAKPSTEDLFSADSVLNP